MSYINAVQQCASSLQAMLSDHFTGIGDGISPDQRPFLQFLNANVAGIKQVINPSPAKRRRVELLYRRPLMASDIDETTAPACSNGDDLGNNLEEYYIDTTSGGDWNGKTFGVTFSDLHCINESFEQYFVKELARLIDGVDAKVSAKAAATLATLVGAFSVDAKASYTFSGNTIQIDYQDSSNNFTPSRWYDLADATEMTGYGPQKVMFGGSKLHGLAKAAQAGCCTTNGVELGQIWSQYGFASVYDRDVAVALGGQAYSAIIQPGAVALLTFNEVGWKNGLPMFQNGANYAHFSVVSPKTGTPMDVKVSDSCGTTLTISVAACTKLVGLPTQLFQENDNYAGVTFVTKAQAV